MTASVQEPVQVENIIAIGGEAGGRSLESCNKKVFDGQVLMLTNHGETVRLIRVDLKPEENVVVHQSSSQHHALLKVDIVVGSAMDQKEVLPIKL